MRLSTFCGLHRDTEQSQQKKTTTRKLRSLSCLFPEIFADKNITVNTKVRPPYELWQHFQVGNK
jgi:hypothetical protein